MSFHHPKRPRPASLPVLLGLTLIALRLFYIPMHVQLSHVQVGVEHRGLGVAEVIAAASHHGWSATAHDHFGLGHHHENRGHEDPGHGDPGHDHEHWDASDSHPDHEHPDHSAADHFDDLRAQKALNLNVHLGALRPLADLDLRAPRTKGRLLRASPLRAPPKARPRTAPPLRGPPALS